MRHINTRSLALFILLLLVTGCQSSAPSGQLGWQQTLDRRLPEYGHRNWIVIADAAYPAQSRDGIETIVTDANQVDVINAVLQKLSATRHVRPIIYTDAELNAVPETDAPGIKAYREQLKGILGDRTAQVIPHEQIIGKLDTAAQTFRVLILKTNMTIPYTSVFLQLDCGYWSADAEKRLRDSMGKSARMQTKNEKPAVADAGRREP